MGHRFIYTQIQLHNIILVFQMNPRLTNTFYKIFREHKNIINSIGSTLWGEREQRTQKLFLINLNFYRP